MELTQQIRDVNDYDKFKERVEKKYGSKVIGHHQEQGIGVLELANGDEVRYWDDKKLIGNPFGPRGARGSHFTKTKYSEFGYKAKGAPKFETNYTLKFGAGTLAYAKRIGMTDAQIRQAERAGVGNADDIHTELDKLVSRSGDVRELDAAGMPDPSTARRKQGKVKASAIRKKTYLGGNPTQVRGMR